MVDRTSGPEACDTSRQYGGAMLSAASVSRSPHPASPLSPQPIDITGRQHLDAVDAVLAVNWHALNIND